MMLALGSAGYVAGIFHLTTSMLFFKALLFFGSRKLHNSVPVHTQNINKMGGLQKKMKVTGTLFLIGINLQLVGFHSFQFFFSKDEILVERLDEW